MPYQTVNPYTSELVQSYPYASEAEIDAAISASHEAFLSWRTTGSEQRSKVLKRAAELLRADKRTFADVLTLEMGKITSEAEAEVELSAEILDYFADHSAELLKDLEALTADLGGSSATASTSASTSTTAANSAASTTKGTATTSTSWVDRHVAQAVAAYSAQSLSDEGSFASSSSTDVTA